MATILDIARLTGISKSTVSRVLSGRGYVKEETRKRVEKAMKELNYTPNYIARGMRTNKTSAIGFFVPDYSNPFYSELFKGIEQVTRKAGYMNLLCHTDEDAKAELYYIGELLKRQIDGIIFCTYNQSPEGLKYLSKLAKTTPIVFMDPVYGDQSFSSVVSDGFSGSRHAVKHLSDKRCKKIGYIKGPRHHAVTGERYRGYREGLKDSNLDFDEELVFEGDFSLNSGKMAVDYFLSLDHIPDGIIAATDLMAIGALHRLNRSGVKVPEEVKIVGFDNIPLSELIDPSLTTVAQPIRDLGINAAELLLKKIDNPAAPDQQILMQCFLIERETTK